MKKLTKLFKNDRNYIGQRVIASKHLKKEFVPKGVFDDLVVLEVTQDKKYGAKATLQSYDEFFDKMSLFTDKERKIAQGKTKEYETKPVDTSNWVKPDEESIRNELVLSLFCCEILDPDCFRFIEQYAKAEILFSLLKSHAPKNPQTLGKFAILSYLETVMSLFKTSKKEMKKCYRILFRENVKSYKEWRNEYLRNMIKAL